MAQLVLRCLFVQSGHENKHEETVVGGRWVDGGGGGVKPGAGNIYIYNFLPYKVFKADANKKNKKQPWDNKKLNYNTGGKTPAKKRYHRTAGQRRHYATKAYPLCRVHETRITSANKGQSP